MTIICQKKVNSDKRLAPKSMRGNMLWFPRTVRANDANTPSEDKLSTKQPFLDCEMSDIASM